MDLVKPKKFTHAEWEESQEVFESRLYLKEGVLTLPPRIICFYRIGFCIQIVFRT